MTDSDDFTLAVPKGRRTYITRFGQRTRVVSFRIEHFAGEGMEGGELFTPISFDRDVSLLSCPIWKTMTLEN